MQKDYVNFLSQAFIRSSKALFDSKIAKSQKRKAYMYIIREITYLRNMTTKYDCYYIHVQNIFLLSLSLHMRNLNKAEVTFFSCMFFFSLTF